MSSSSPLSTRSRFTSSVSQYSPATSQPRYRNRTLSLSSVSSTQSRITLGFPKTELALVGVHTLPHSVYGSFIPTPSARTSLDHIKRSSNIQKTRPFLSLRTHSSKTDYLWVEDDDSPLSSGLPSPTIPSFSRTTSSSSVPGDISPTFASSCMLLSRNNPRPGHTRRHTEDLNPVLAKLERRSKILRKQVYCATCNKPGTDYPKCGKCNAMWCSRECRMFGGKRHACNLRTSKSKQ